MQKKTVIIILFLFACTAIQAQGNNDSTTHFEKLFFYQLLDVQHKKTTTINTGNKPLLLCIFLSPECPLCQNYTKPLNELQQKFNQQISMYGIVPGTAYTIKDMAAFQNKVHTTFPILIDAEQKFTQYLQATVTPQVILLDKEGTLIYKGAIDDWVQAQGKKKAQPTQYYLQDAIQQSLQPEVVKIKKTTAFGCKINDH